MDTSNFNKGHPDLLSKLKSSHPVHVHVHISIDKKQFYTFFSVSW